jgi:hypothetical protein
MDSTTRYYGVYRGIVKDSKDPQKQRRLKVSISQTTGDEVTDWAWPMEPSSINTDVPVVGQGVWVTFIGGDPDYPVWSGAFGKNQGKNKKMFIKPLDDKTSLTGLSAHIVLIKNSDGTTDVDLTATLMALANKVKTLEGKVTTLEGKVTTLEGKVSTLKSTLATRTSGGHTHTTNG